MKSIALTVGVTILILLGGVYLLTRNNEGESNSTDILPSYHQYFWSKTCPHCTNVAEFINTWEGKDVFEMEKIEVNESRENSLIFLDRGTKICKIPRSTLGVPLLVTPEGKCFTGDTLIIEYLKSLEQ